MWKDDVSLLNFDNTIHLICSYFSRSPKRIRVLSDQEEEILGFHLKLLKPLEIRWLSIYKVIERIYDLYPALISN